MKFIGSKKEELIKIAGRQIGKSETQLKYIERYMEELKNTHTICSICKKEIFTGQNKDCNNYVCEECRKNTVKCNSCGIDMGILNPSLSQDSYFCNKCIGNKISSTENKKSVNNIRQEKIKNMEDKYELKDSGKRQEFSTGAIRDTAEGKGRYDLISPIATKRLAIVLEKGAKKYFSRNWERGMNLSRLVDSAKRHLDQFLEGNRDEDHAGQAMFNIMALIHTEEMIKRGILPSELNDLPDYLKKDD